MSESTKSNIKVGSHSDSAKNTSNIPQNKAIDDYFKVILNGLLASGAGGREDQRLIAKAMAMAITAYGHRCTVLGQTYAKNINGGLGGSRSDSPGSPKNTS